MYLVINKWVIAVKVSNFSGQYLRNHWTLAIGVLGYIVIVWPKEHSPEVWHIPPGTPCIYISYSPVSYMFRQPTAIHSQQHQCLKPDEARYIHAVVEYVTFIIACHDIKYISFKCLISVLWTAVPRYWLIMRNYRNLSCLQKQERCAQWYMQIASVVVIKTSRSTERTSKQLAAYFGL